VSDFKKLLVWQKAHALALHAHRVAMGIRRSHDLALRSQIIRAAMSIPANIVEGRRQESEKGIRQVPTDRPQLSFRAGVSLDSGP
jgi:hypothetical protein